MTRFSTLQLIYLIALVVTAILGFTWDRDWFMVVWTLIIVVSLDLLFNKPSAE